MSFPPLSGPANLPANPTHALVCLHGFGDSGASYTDFGPMLRASLPASLQLGVFCPNAPMPTPDSNEHLPGRQWFSDMGWTFRDRPGIRSAADALWAYIQTEVAEAYGIPLPNIAVMGFSQGAMVTYYAVPRFPSPLAGAIAHSGLSLWDAELNPKTCEKTPFLILHGEDDDVVAADASLHAAAGLEKAGIPYETVLLPNLGHGLDARSLAQVSVFLAERWASPQPLADGPA